MISFSIGFRGSPKDFVDVISDVFLEIENIDYCVDEHRAWLDKGELGAIIKALEVEINTKEVSEYAVASVEEALEIVKGDEGFISEWNDFLSVIRLLQYRVLSENPKLQEALIALQASQSLG